MRRLRHVDRGAPELSNTKSRRAKLTADKLQVLADLGLEWAAA